MDDFEQLPHSFDIEIDAENLTRYYRQQWGLMAFFPTFGLGAFFGFAFGLGRPEDREFESVSEILLSVGLGITVGICIGGFIWAVLYFFLIKRNAATQAKSLQVTVEGPFLRIRKGRNSIRDRKLHFKAIIDYCYFQDSMMQSCGIHGITLSTMAGGRSSDISIHGVKDAIRVRDMLCEVDRLREDS